MGSSPAIRNPAENPSEAEIEELWVRWNESGVICPVGQGPFALSIDSATAMYRLSCVCCGKGPTWFELSEKHVRIRRPGTSERPTDSGELLI